MRTEFFNWEFTKNRIRLDLDIWSFKNTADKPQAQIIPVYMFKLQTHW